MGRKSAAKGQTPPPERPAPKRPFPMLLAAAVAAIALGAGAFLYWQQNAAGQDAAAAPTYAPLASDLKPHHQDKLPPLEFPAYQPTRAPEVIRAAYTFAA